VLVDGREAGTGASVEVALPAGSWVVFSRCGDAVSRARTITVAAGDNTAVVLDPTLDARTRVGSNGVALRYSTQSEARALLVDDLASLGLSAHVRRVASRWGANIVVVDPERRVVTAVVAATGAESQLAAALSRADSAALPLPEHEGPASGAGQPPVDARAVAVLPEVASASPWPWAVVGTGVAALGVGVALNFMHNAEQSSLVSMCRDRGDQVVCHRSLMTLGDDVATLDTARVATFIAGSVLVTGGLVWWLLDRSRARSVSANRRVAPTMGMGGVGFMGRF
jgi:hypothetical protein